MQNWCKFNVGDIVVGLPEASKVYTFTKAGVRCEVVIIRDSTSMYVRILDAELAGAGENWLVEPQYFALEKERIYYNEKENKISYRKLNEDYKEIYVCA